MKRNEKSLRNLKFFYFFFKNFVLLNCIIAKVTVDFEKEFIIKGFKKSQKEFIRKNKKI